MFENSDSALSPAAGLTSVDTEVKGLRGPRLASLQPSEEQQVDSGSKPAPRPDDTCPFLGQVAQSAVAEAESRHRLTPC